MSSTNAKKKRVRPTFPDAQVMSMFGLKEGKMVMVGQMPRDRQDEYLASRNLVAALERADTDYLESASEYETRLDYLLLLSKMNCTSKRCVLRREIEERMKNMEERQKVREVIEVWGEKKKQKGREGQTKLGETRRTMGQWTNQKEMEEQKKKRDEEKKKKKGPKQKEAEKKDEPKEEEDESSAESSMETEEGTKPSKEKKEENKQ